MGDPAFVYEQAYSRLTNLAISLRGCLLRDDMKKAETDVEQLRRYDKCAYCKAYRLTVAERGWSGVCGDCPLGRYGERLSGEKALYNGCYKIGDYRSMVKAAYWFRNDPSKESLKSLIESLDKVLDHFARAREELAR